MPTNSYGFTPEVIQQSMPDFRLSGDLIRTILATIPPPARTTSIAWRQERVARIIEESTAYLAADAAQGRLAAQIIIMREVSDDTQLRSHAPGLAEDTVSRLRRTSDALGRTAVQLERMLERRQQRPTPFWGNQAANSLDVAALAASWGQAVPAEPSDDAGRGDAAAESGVAESGMAETAVVDAGPAGLRQGQAVGRTRGPGLTLDEAPPAPGPAVGRTRGPDTTLDEPAVSPASAGAGSLASTRAGSPDMPLDPPRRSREGVRVEQGEGWSMEIWPAPASLRAANETSAQLSQHRETAMADNAPVARPVAASGATGARPAGAADQRVASAMARGTDRSGTAA